MKKLFQILFCLLLCCSAFAQEKKDSVLKNTKEGKWSVGIGGGPLYGFESGGEIPYWSAGAGFILQYSVHKYFYLAVNGTYDQLAYTYETFGPAYWDSRYSFWNLNLTGNLRFKIKKFEFSIGAGLQSGILNTNSLVISNGFGSTTFQNYANGTAIAFGNFNLNLKYKINRRLYVFMNPEYVKAFTPLREYSVTYPAEYSDYYLEYVKINIGITWNLKK